MKNGSQPWIATVILALSGCSAEIEDSGNGLEIPVPGAVQDEGVAHDSNATASVATPAPPADPAPLPLRRELLERVAVVGASMSDGFQLSRDLADVLDVVLPDDRDPVVKSATMFFFTNPLETGPNELEMVGFEDPTVLVGVDFLFWYGYGTLGVGGVAIEDEGDRLELLEEGLSLLDEVEVPLILGDFPNMENAIGGMLAEEQVPAPETLVALNARLREWAAERPDVRIVPLQQAVELLRADEAFSLGRVSYPAGSSVDLLQADDLHPTLEGLCVIAQLVALELCELRIALEEDLQLDVQAMLEELVAPAGPR